MITAANMAYIATVRNRNIAYRIIEADQHQHMSAAPIPRSSFLLPDLRVIKHGDSTTQDREHVSDSCTARHYQGG